MILSIFFKYLCFSHTSLKAAKETPESLFARFADDDRDGLAITLQGISDLCT
jgi:hypothetical protein